MLYSIQEKKLQYDWVVQINPTDTTEQYVRTTFFIYVLNDSKCEQQSAESTRSAC